MTHLEKFLALYKEFGIMLPETINQDGNTEIRLDSSCYDEVDCEDKTEEKNKIKKFNGYCSFFSIVTFTPEGKFINQGFWE